MYLDQATISIGAAVKDVLYGYAEFEHLQDFLNVYIHDNYQIVIPKGNNEFIVAHVLNRERLYHHHSYSNCVEWVFNNCPLDKEETE